MKSERLACAYCPYTSLHHDFIMKHLVDHHSSDVLCYGCLNKQFNNLSDLKAHLVRKHPNDRRAWDTFEYYNTRQKKTFLYFGKDVRTGNSKQYFFVAGDVVNDCA